MNIISYSILPPAYSTCRLLYLPSGRRGGERPLPFTPWLSGLCFYKRLFYFAAFVHESTILLLPPPPALSTRLQDYFKTIARYLNPI